MSLTYQPRDFASSQLALAERNPLLRLPIVARLLVGFAIPAIIAALAAGAIGIQSVQTLNAESDFYQNLFSSYASLATGENYLQLMHSKLHNTLDDGKAPRTSRADLLADQAALKNLAARYDSILTGYTRKSLLIQHPNQIALFAQAGHEGQAAQQQALAMSALRTWQVYHSAQDQILQNILDKNILEAQNMDRQQGEPTMSDALGALHTLLQFNGKLVVSVHDVIDVEQRNLLFITLASAGLVFLTIVVIGWMVSDTLISRLQKLHSVARLVERGEVHARVNVTGRDEISTVSASMNSMLDTIVGLLEETRHQHEAMMKAAERLFIDMRLANGGELHLKLGSNNDPVAVLANAFDFTIGRFRRFVLHTQTTIKQLEVVSRHETEYTQAFVQSMHTLLHKNSSSSGVQLSPIQLQEFAHLADNFTQNMFALAQHLNSITQEMRTNLAPFRLDEKKKRTTVPFSPR